MIIWLFCFTAISLGHSQSFFNTVYGDEYFSGSARNASMGEIPFSNQDFNSSISVYPSGLISSPGVMSAEVSGNGISYLERRSMPLKDMFGDFLVDGDYAVNRDFQPAAQFAFRGASSLGDLKLGAGLSLLPFSSFDYTYSEEVRDRQNFGDGIIGIRDPIVGYHLLKSRGSIDMVSAGFAAGYPLNANIELRTGFSVNMLQTSDLSLSQTTEIIDSSSVNISQIQPFHYVYQVSSNTSTTFSAGMVVDHHMSFMFSYRPEITLEKSTPADTINISGFGLSPELVSHFNDYYLNGINSNRIYYPEKLSVGLNFIPKSPMPMEISLEFIWEPYSNISTGKFDDVHTWKLGVEYLALQRTPVRVGYIFKQSPIPSISPETIFTFGSGLNFGALTVDFSGSYGTVKYMFPDLFVVDGDVRPDLDTVTESRFDTRLTLSYGFTL